MLQLMHIQYECALDAAFHGYILGVHMNDHTLLNNVMLMARPNRQIFQPFPRVYYSYIICWLAHSTLSMANKVEGNIYLHFDIFNLNS